jgi:nucleoid-associated protein YgaU
MFVRRRVVLVLALALAVALALAAARPTTGAGHETRYVVRPGDTLWEIATARYAGDPREAIWRIQRRNGLESAALSPGQVLALPP